MIETYSVAMNAMMDEMIQEIHDMTLEKTPPATEEKCHPYYRQL